MREPAAWLADPGPRRSPEDVIGAIRFAARGVWDARWDPPAWLLPHQRDAAPRLAAALRIFGGALLADAVGLGKSWLALALATRYRRVTLVVPATVRTQWRDLAAARGVAARIVTHEALSRDALLVPADLLVVDEAHRFRNPATRRYDALARQIRDAAVLLLTATPVVNRSADLVHLLRLFLADHALAGLGVPSLAGAVSGAPEPLLHAVAPLVVARSAGVARLGHHMPVPHDTEVLKHPSVPPEQLRRCVRAIRGLAFPPLTGDARTLLRHHLFMRLSSSPAALRESLRRHRAYLSRAAHAASTGEALPRGIARRLFGPDDDPQLPLELQSGLRQPLDTAALDRERDRLDALERVVREAAVSPKRDAVLQVLATRRDRKTVVFTTSRATALDLARHLHWHRVATVAARGARIASGPVTPDDAFSLFAPLARGRSPVPESQRIQVLLATDLASEGLNLQDADGIVHYDLPWTPLRLAQRLGRLARLGSRHARVDVWWFVPPTILERPLRLVEAITRKARLQLALVVPTTSRVGKGGVDGGTLEQRERAARRSGTPARGHATLRGAGTVCVLSWETPHGPVREVVRHDGRPADWAVADRTDLAESAEAPDGPTLAAIRRTVAHRARRALVGPHHHEGRRLFRRVLALARAAARARDRMMLVLLDGVLERLRAGVAVGAERELASRLSAPGLRALEQWLQLAPVRHPRLSTPTLEAALFGAEIA